MRVFRAVVEPTANLVTVGVADLFHRCGIRAKPVGDDVLEVAQELYDGQGKKIITYPRAEVRYLPESLISDV